MPLWLWALIGLPRILILFLVWGNPAYIMVPDSSGYLAAAQNLANHHQFTVPTGHGEIPETSRTPGYPVFLMIVGMAGGGSPIAVALAQSLLAVFTLWLAWIWLTALSGVDGATTAVAILATDLVCLLHAPMILAETLFSAVIMAALLLTWRTLHDGKMRTVAGAGFLWGIACMIKPVILFWPAFLSLLWIKRRKAWAIFLACAYVLPFLWVLRNYSTANYAGFSSQGGGDLLKGPAAAVEAMLRHQSYGTMRVELINRVNQAYPQGFASEVEQSKAYGHEAIRILAVHPFLVFCWCASGTVRILFGPGLEMIPDLLEWPRNPVQGPVGLRGLGTLLLLRTYPGLLPILVFYLLELFFVYLFFMKGCRRLWEQHRTVELFIVLSGCLYFLLIANHQGYYRYRIPMMPFLAAGLAVGISEKPRRRHDP